MPLFSPYTGLDAPQHDGAYDDLRDAEEAAIRQRALQLEESGMTVVEALETAIAEYNAQNGFLREMNIN